MTTRVEVERLAAQREPDAAARLIESYVHHFTRRGDYQLARVWTSDTDTNREAWTRARMAKYFPGHLENLAELAEENYRDAAILRGVLAAGAA